MAASFRQFDEHGLPLPQRYSDIKQYQLEQTDDEAPRRPKISLRTKRIILLVALLGFIVPVFFGPRIVATAWKMYARWLTDRAEQRLAEGDLPGALEYLSSAIEWTPDDWQLYQGRAHLHEQMMQLENSLADYSKCIEILNTKDDVRFSRRFGFGRSFMLAETYSARSMIHVRLKHSREAIDDATQALRQEPGPIFLNGRAYVRALVNMELEDGLADVEKALAESNNDQPDYLDTRGYLLHLLDRDAEALPLMDRAIKHSEQDVALQQPFMTRQEIEHAILQHRQALAVMYHHRGLINEKLDRREQASQDLKHGDALGYDPERGVF